VAVVLENSALAERQQRTLDELNMVNRRLIGQAWNKYLQASEQISAEWREGAWIKNADEKRETAISIAPHQAANLQLPIKVRGQTVGEFDVTTSRASHVWAEEDIAFAQALIDQVGQTIENARLLEETERLAGRERTINTINTRVRQNINRDAILKTAVEELGRSLGAARVFVQIGEPDTGAPAAGSGNGKDGDHA